MKKFMATLLIALSLSFSIVRATDPQNTSKPLTEGVYDPTKLGIQLSDLHNVQNVSETDLAYFVIYNEEETILQSIKLVPKSHKYELYPLDPSYRLVIIGKGSVILS